jgi:hypothetical protein
MTSLRPIFFGHIDIRLRDVIGQENNDAKISNDSV